MRLVIAILVWLFVLASTALAQFVYEISIAQVGGYESEKIVLSKEEARVTIMKFRKQAHTGVSQGKEVRRDARD